MNAAFDVSILDHLLEGCQLIGFDYRYMYINDVAARQGQRTKGEYLGHTMMELYPGIESTPMFLLLEQCLDERKPARIENEFHFPDGSSSWFELKMEPVPQGAFILSMDISERKKRDAALQHSLERLEVAEQIAGLGNWEWEVEGKQGYWSKQMFRLFGLEHAEQAPSFGVYLERIHPEDRPHILEALDQMSRGLEPTVYEYRSNPKYGPVRVLSPTWQCLKDQAGKTYKYLGTVLDITERKRVEKHIEIQLQWLNALHAIDVAIANTLEIHLTLNLLIEVAITQLGVDAADILLFESAGSWLNYVTGKGFCTDHIQKGDVRVGEGIAGHIALEQKMVYIPDLGEMGERFTRAPLYAGEGFVVYAGFPLRAKGQLKGVLEIYRRTPFEPTEEWFSFLETIAGQAAIAIDQAQLFESLQRSNIHLSLAYDATIEGWSRAMELRDRETQGHTQRVTDLTLRLAKAVGMKEDEIVHVRRGALLHDVGKLGVPDSILLKPGKLTDEEFVIIQQHPQYAFDMLANIPYLQPALDIPYCHHEKWNGLGYPRGLKGKQIPLAARLFAVVDVWDALLTDRPYHAPWPQEKVQEYIWAEAGSHFDPQAVELFFKVMKG